MLQFFFMGRAIVVYGLYTLIIWCQRKPAKMLIYCAPNLHASEAKGEAGNSGKISAPLRLENVCVGCEAAKAVRTTRTTRTMMMIEAM